MLKEISTMDIVGGETVNGSGIIIDLIGFSYE